MYIIQLVCGIPEWLVTIKTDCEELYATTKKVFFSMLKNDDISIEKNNGLNICIKSCDDSFLIETENKSYKCEAIIDVLFSLYQLIDRFTENFQLNSCCVFHGGVVSNGKKAIGLLAPTMTGKSTLTAYLSMNGYDYLSDDYIFVNRENQNIYSFKLPIIIRDKTPLQPLANSCILAEGKNSIRNEYNYFIGNFNRDYVTDKISLFALIILNRGKGNCLRPLSKGELYKELLYNMKNNLRYDLDRMFFVDLINYVKGYYLSYTDLTKAKQIVDSIVDTGGDL